MIWVGSEVQQRVRVGRLFGGGVWWFRSPPARGATVSGGGPDHELPHPPRATATNSLPPLPPLPTHPLLLHHQHRHPSNPKPTGRQRSAEAAAACLFNILKKLKYLCGLTHIHTQLRITHPRARRGTHARTRARSHTFTHVCDRSI